MIIRGQLGPGARLPREKGLALELNVSRGPLRERVRALCLTGVLETRQASCRLSLEAIQARHEFGWGRTCWRCRNSRVISYGRRR
jgi:DNA-binding GntR family transcriptional regulator